MSLRTVVVAGLFAVLSGVGLVAAGPASGSGCPGCGVGTGPGQYVGSLLIPPGSRPVPAGLTALAAQCAGCLWMVEPACQRPGATGGSSCPGALLSCRPQPPVRLRLALLLQRPGEPAPSRVGTFCFDPAVPLQPQALVPGVRDRFVRLVPALRPTFQPARFGIVNVPVVFAAGQRGSIGRPTFALAGHRVTLEATASWLWDFGDGRSVRSVVPGGAWPVVAVAHPYRAVGRFAVRVTSVWQAQFWVDGAGPFGVAGAPVTQTAVVTVPVRAAHAELVAAAG
jgi:PKD domain